MIYLRRPLQILFLINFTNKHLSKAVSTPNIKSKIFYILKFNIIKILINVIRGNFLLIF